MIEKLSFFLFHFTVCQIFSIFFKIIVIYIIFISNLYQMKDRKASAGINTLCFNKFRRHLSFKLLNLDSDKVSLDSD